MWYSVNYAAFACIDNLIVFLNAYIYMIGLVSFETLYSDTRFISGGYFINKSAELLSHKEAQAFCKNLRGDIMHPLPDMDVLTLFNYFNISTSVWTDYYKSSLSEELLSEKDGYPTVLTTKFNAIEISEVRLSLMTTLHGISLVRLGNRFLYTMSLKEEKKEVLCLNIIDFPKGNILQLNKIKVGMLSQLTIRKNKLIRQRLGMKNSINLMPTLIVEPEIESQNYLNISPALNLRVETFQLEAPKIAIKMKKIDGILDIIDLENSHQLWLSEFDDIAENIDLLFGRLINLGIKDIEIEEDNQFQGKVMVYKFKTDFNKFFVHFGKMEVGENIKTTATTTFLSLFHDFRGLEFYQMSVYDIIFGLITLICLISAIIQMCILTKLSKRLRKQKETEQQLTVFKLRTFPEKKSKLKAKKKVRIQTDQKKLKQPTTSESNKNKATVFGKPKKAAKPKSTKSIKYFRNTVDPDFHEMDEFLPERLSMRNELEYKDIPLHLVPSVENIEHSYL